MKFPLLEVENFLSIGTASISLDGKGLVGVAGENQDDSSADSNGTGKSSLVDALCWCLWGTTARGVSGDDVISWGVGRGEGTRVAVTVDDNGDIYKVVRHRKYPKHKHALQLFKIENGVETDLTKGTTALTQAQIERLLGCSEEVFNAAVYSGQEAMPDIPNMTDKQLKLLVEQAAGVDVLSNAYDIARERARSASETRAQAQIAYDRTTERLSDAYSALANAEQSAANWDTNQASNIEGYKRDAVQKNADYLQAHKSIDPSATATIDEKIAAVQKRIDAVADERQKEQSLQTVYNAASTSYTTAKSNVTAAENNLDVAKRAVTQWETQLEETKKGVGKPCKSCSRPLEKDHLAAAIAVAQAGVDERKEMVTKATEELAQRQVKLAAAEKMLNDADAELVSHRENMTDISGATQEIQILQRERQQHLALEAEVERLKQIARSAAEAWQRAQQQTNPFTDMIATHKATIEEREKAVAAAEQTAVTAIEEEQYAQAVVTVFAPAGVRARRLDEATPYLNQRTAHYLGSLADGDIDAFWTTITESKNKKDLLEKFSVTVEKKSSAGQGSFKNLSGGEKRKVRLACALALQDLVATRAAKSIDLWVGDEIDDALDDAGLERLMGVLEEKARDRGTVLVISHNDIKDFTRRQLIVTKVGGKATVKEA